MHVSQRATHASTLRNGPARRRSKGSNPAGDGRAGPRCVAPEGSGGPRGCVRGVTGFWGHEVKRRMKVFTEAFV